MECYKEETQYGIILIKVEVKVIYSEIHCYQRCGQQDCFFVYSSVSLVLIRFIIITRFLIKGTQLIPCVKILNQNTPRSVLSR